MTIEEFGKSIKTKYPQYSDISDADLGQKMLAKYPQYSDMVNTKITSEPQKGLIQKTGEVAGDVLSGVGKGATSTVIGLGQVVLRGLSLIPQFKDIAEQSIQTGEDIKKTQLVPKNLAEGLGKTGEQIGEFFIPVGLEAQVAKQLSKIPTIAKEAPALAKAVQGLMKVGAKSVASGAEFAGKTYLQTGGDKKQALEVGVITGLLTPISSIIKGTGKIAGQSVIPLSSKEAKLVQSYKADVPFWERVFGISSKKAPTTAGKTAFEKGLMGTESGIGIKAKKTSNKLWNEIVNPALKTSNAKIDLPNFWNEIRQTIIKKNPELSRQKDLLEALKALKESYKNVKLIKPEMLQKFKEGWAEFIPQKAYMGKDIAGAFNQVKNVAANTARNVLYNILGPEAKQAYLDYGNLKGLQELGQKAMTGGKLKGGFGSFWSAVKDMAIVPIGTIGGQTIYKIGQAIEFVGKPGIKTISDLFSD